MLIQFTVDNFLSLKDEVLFSMVSGKNNKKNSFKARSFQLLTSSVIYGANASGKSNLLKAFKFMKGMVLNSNKVMQSTDRLPHEPFLLNTETESASSTFEIVFIQNEVKYRYGFEADAKTVFSEWLFADQKGKEAKLFFRDDDGDVFYVNPERFKEGRGLKVLGNHLFLWKCDQEGGEISQSILKWFSKLNMLNGMQPTDYMRYTLDKMKDEPFRQQILKLTQAADLGIQDVQIDEAEVSDAELESLPIPKELKSLFQAQTSPLTRMGIRAVHNKWDDDGVVVGTAEFDFSRMESEGTQKYFSLSAPLIDSLLTGKILLIDELDASLHPMLTMALVSLFNDPEVNTKNAQLVFVTHDTNLLDAELFHKSQIWFAEKDSFQSTHLISLVEYNAVRGKKFEKHYIQGKYGAIPYLGNFNLKG